MVGLVGADEAAQEGGRQGQERPQQAMPGGRAELHFLLSQSLPSLEPADPRSQLSRAKDPKGNRGFKQFLSKHQLLGFKVAELCFFLSLLRPSVCPGSVSTPALLISAGL